MVNSQITKSGDMWMCNVCDYQSNKKFNCQSHVESKHIVSNGFNCTICGLFCPNRKSLKNHTDRKHKQ